MVRFHLTMCPPCRRVDASLRRTLDALAALDEAAPDAPAEPARDDADR